MKLNKAKCKVLPTGQGKPKHKYRLGGERIESSPEEKDSGVPADEKLNVTQQCALTVQKAYCTLGCIKSQQVEGGDSAPLLRSGKTPPGALRPALEPSVQERHGPVGAGPEEGHKNDQRDGAPVL